MNTGATKSQYLIRMPVLLTGACSDRPPNLDEHLLTAMTPSVIIGDRIIQGRNDFMVFDLRPKPQFKSGHVLNAVWMAPERLSYSSTLRAFPDYKKLVFYDTEGKISAERFRPLL